MPEAACRKPPCKRPSTAVPLPRAIGVPSYFWYISLWQPIHIASGFGERAEGGGCSLGRAETLIGEWGKTQTTKTASTRVDRAGTAQPKLRTDLQEVIRIPHIDGNHRW